MDMKDGVPRGTGVWFFTVAAAIFLSACTQRPTGVLAPVTLRTEGASRVDMLVATTREKSPASGVMFSGERGPIAYADITVSIPPDATRKIGEVQWPSSLPGDPVRDFVTLRTNALDERQAARWLHKAGAPRHVLVFVHGFNNRFEDAVYRFAQIQHDSGAPTVPVLFTWPSRGSVWAYGYDLESTNYSRNALETLLRTLARDPSVGEITILAHSMGNLLTLEALRQMAIRERRVAPKIRNVMLAAPDVDVDVFNTQIAEMGASRPHFTLFVSRDDRALQVSRRIWGDNDRLGAIDVTKEPYAAQLAKNRVTAIDLTQVAGISQLNHSKFAGSEVVQLIGRRLAAGQTINDYKVGIGDHIANVTVGAATTAGSAAGLLLTAPIAVVDPETRRTYGNRIDAFGNTLSDAARGRQQ
jgi:esterase/lipase superfamily enzyme